MEFQPDFIRLIGGKKYCNGREIDEVSLKIYFFYIQDAWIRLNQLLKFNGQNRNMAFAMENMAALEETLYEFGRLRSCFDAVFREAAGYYHATIEETLADYKVGLADYIEQNKISIYPDGSTNRFREEAGEHFMNALGWYRQNIAIHQPRESELMEWLSTEPHEISAHKIRSKLDRLTKSAQWR